MHVEKFKKLSFDKSFFMLRLFAIMLIPVAVIYRSQARVRWSLSAALVGILIFASAPSSAQISSRPDALSILVNLLLNDLEEPNESYVPQPGILPPPVVPLPDAPKTLTRTTAYEYSNKGALLREIIEPDNSQLRIDVVYPLTSYDAYGNRTSATLSSPAVDSSAIESRSIAAGYDARGRFNTSNTNALGQVSSAEFEPRFGLPTQNTDSNLLSTISAYDSFGRKIRETHPDGTQIKWDYLYCAGIKGSTVGCPQDAKYVVVTTPLAQGGGTANGPWERNFYDSWDRVIETNTLAFDGTSVIRKFVRYDKDGNVSQVSRPHYTTQSPEVSNFYYDIYNRVTLKIDPSGAQTSYQYDGQITSVTNSLNQTSTQVRDIIGRIVTVKDSAPSHNALNYKYDPFDNLTHTIDSYGNVVSSAYNIRGHKLRTVDPDLGSWVYSTDALGNVVRQTDPKSQTTTFTFDKLQRLVARNEIDLISAWNYDNCYKGVGAVCSVTSNNGYERKYVYDNLSRISSVNTTIDDKYSVSFTYDSNGRKDTQTYPGGFSLKYNYNSAGYLKDIRNSSNNFLYWRADEIDAEGNVQRQTYGNNVGIQQEFDKKTGYLKNIYSGSGNNVQNLSFDYDSLGNLLSRKDGNRSLTEGFLYDSLNRLTNSTVNSPGAGVVAQSYSYDNIGNLEYRSDSGNIKSGAVNARPHGVSKIEYPGGGTRLFNYDPNGSLTSDDFYDSANRLVNGAGRRLSYTSFNMPLEINAPGANFRFNYGPEHQRTKSEGSSGTTIYVHPDNIGGLIFEKDIIADGSVIHNNYITVNGMLIAVVKKSSSGYAVRYIHQDSLGSVSTITDEAGQIVEKLAYEPFGKRRAPTGMLDSSGTLRSSVSDRGFTTAEHFDQLGLIHMNGRLYDPSIGRFTSADPTIPDVTNMQSYNRYAYVRNNPLIFIDPSGYADKLAQSQTYGSDPTWWEPGTFTVSPTDGFFVKFAFSSISTVRGNYYHPNHAAAREANYQAPVGLAAATAAFSQASAVAADFLNQANRSFGLFDMFVPARDSFEQGVRRMLGICYYDCYRYNVLVQSTADVAQGSGYAVAEAYNRFYPEIAKMAVMSSLPELSLLKGAVKIHPSQIRFSQASVNGVDEIVVSMRKYGWSGEPIDVVRMKDGMLTTFDNTRLLAAQRAGIRVHAVVRDGAEAFPASRWTPRKGPQPTTWEEAINARINMQNRLYRTTYPDGSPYVGSQQ